MSEEEGLRGGWFSAKVLVMKDKQALLLYDELLAEDGPFLSSFLFIRSYGSCMWFHLDLCLFPPFVPSLLSTVVITLLCSKNYCGCTSGSLGSLACVIQCNSSPFCLPYFVLLLLWKECWNLVWMCIFSLILSKLRLLYCHRPISAEWVASCILFTRGWHQEQEAVMSRTEKIETCAPLLFQQGKGIT